MAETKKRQGSAMPDVARGMMMVNDSDNPGTIATALECFVIDKVDLNDLEDVKSRVGWYFRKCGENQNYPSVIGLRNALGISQRKLNEIRRNECTKPSEILIQRAYGCIEQIMTERIANSRYNCAGMIFLSKVFFDYRETSEVIITPSTPLSDIQSAEELEREIAALPDVE